MTAEPVDELDAVPTPLEMVEQVHRIPDGTRRLVIGRKLRSIRVGQSATRSFTCQAFIHATDNGLTPPMCCQREIQAGRFMVIYQAIHPSTEQRGSRKAYYCAPCAISQWSHWEIAEVDE